MPLLQTDLGCDLQAEFYESPDGWRWRYRSDNHQIYQASHQAFETAAGAKKNLESFCELAMTISHVQWVKVDA